MIDDSPSLITPRHIPSHPPFPYVHQPGPSTPIPGTEPKTVYRMVLDPETGAMKADGEKNRLELLPFEAIEEIGKVLTYGATKYSPDNWRPGMSWRRLVGSTLRHIFSWCRGESIDPETGLSHLAHAGCCILFLISYELRNVGTDDRYIMPNERKTYDTTTGTTDTSSSGDI